MHGSDRIDCFTRDVDRLLREAGRIDTPANGEYREDLLLAAELAVTDFSDESENRASLRRELLSRSAAPRPPANRLARLTWPWRQAPAMSTIATVLLLAGIVAVAQPDIRASVIQPVLRYVERIFLGERTQAVVVERPDDHEVDAILAERARGLEAGERWTMRTAVSTIGGDVPPGRDPIILTYCSLGLAESVAAFPIAQPGRLPDGFHFDRAMIPPDDSVVLWYARPGERITLRQTPVRPEITTVEMSMGADSSLEEVTIDGCPAVWMGRKLVWEADGTSYTLEGTEFTLDDALEIARSLRRSDS